MWRWYDIIMANKKPKRKIKKVLDKQLDVCYEVGNVKRKTKFNFRTETENENRNRISVWKLKIEIENWITTPI